MSPAVARSTPPVTPAPAHAATPAIHQQVQALISNQSQPTRANRTTTRERRRQTASAEDQLIDILTNTPFTVQPQHVPQADEGEVYFALSIVPQLVSFSPQGRAMAHMRIQVVLNEVLEWEANRGQQQRRAYDPYRPGAPLPHQTGHPESYGEDQDTSYHSL
uniref:BESS domain-containing protein n=1 Tax=Knipowitschia caucasica TaxID=637954 RepID=A0AAV2J9V9_KNICA